MPLFDVPKYKKGDGLHAATINAHTEELRKLNRVRTGSGLSSRMGMGGLAMGVVFPVVAKIAKTGGSGIAAMTGSTPGSGAITLYDYDGSTLVAGQADVAKNLATGADGAIAATAWVVVVEIDGFWFVLWETCP